MTRDDFLDKQYELSVQAGMNQRYHQRYATWYWQWDAGIKAVTAAAAVIGLALSIATAFPNSNPYLVGAEVFLAIVTTVAAVVLNVIPVGNWEQFHRDFFRQWTDLREELESLLYECQGEPDSPHIMQLQKLEGKMHRICGQEPSPNDNLIRICFEAEKKSRKAADEAQAQAAA